MAKELPEWFVKRLKGVTAKRARTVIDHILEHGQITTEELNELYGYNHPPRAARDVRENGIPLDTIKVTGSDGRKIGAYVFGDPEAVEKGKLGGRKVISKEFKDSLIAQDGSCCAVCLADYEGRYLQVDHCIPYEVAGDQSVENERELDDYMLLCGSCNRAKSWSCEHCSNWLNEKSSEVCGSCYWASPADYDHAATRQTRRLDISWDENETAEHDAARTKAESLGLSLSEFVKQMMKKTLGE